MFEIIGKYNKAKVYATTVDNGSYAQVLKMCNMEKLKNSKIAKTKFVKNKVINKDRL